MTNLATLRPVQELGADRPHGERLRYLAGCRCMLCRAGNSRYKCARRAERAAGRGNGIVSAKRVRAKLRSLSSVGVGYKTAARAAGVSPSVLALILRGKRTNCRAATERAVLAVKPRAVRRPGALVDSKQTWARIDKLLAVGGKKAWIAKAMGMKVPALQLRHGRIRKRTADRVEALYRRVFGREED